MKKQGLAIIFCLMCSLQTLAVEPMIWTVDSRSEISRGEAKGVSVDENGTIRVAPKLTEVFKTEQSYIWSSAVDAGGNVYLGTGNDGKIFKVETSGKGTLVADLNELDVSALAIAKDGSLLASTSPDGKVYRITADGKSEVYFDPPDKYIWSLAMLSDGSLIVGTGETGKIYRVKSANAKPETSLIFDSSDTHIISLAVDKQGNFYAGTDSNGLVLRFSPEGKPFALLDAPLREIHEIAVGQDGSLYVLALSDSASAAKPTSSTLTSTEGATATVISVETSPTDQTPKSRYDLSVSKSAVFRVFPDGKSEIIWNSPSVTAFSVQANPNGNGVFLGTSDKGRIYQVTNDGKETLLLQSGEGQISTILSNGTQILATSSNQGKLYRFGSETNSEGIYESAVKDGKTTALWGRIWWRSSGNVEIQTRQGNTEKPDETWGSWSSSLLDPKGGQITGTKSRFFQWRAILKANSFLNEVSVSYLPQNIAPEILSIQISPTNVGLQPNQPQQIDPNIETLNLDPQIFGLQPNTIPAPRKVYQRGAKAITWTAEDRNNDKLVYSLYYKEVGEANFKLLRENLIENFFSLDGLAFADGRYIFKLVVKDSPSNPAGQSLSGEKISEAIEIDNTAPLVTVVGNPQISGDKVKVVFEAVDSSSFIKRAEFSVNGGEWQTIYAEDGISDSGKERYQVELSLKESGEYAVALRVFDSQGNIGNAKTSVKR